MLIRVQTNMIDLNTRKLGVLIFNIQYLMFRKLGTQGHICHLFPPPFHSTTSHEHKYTEQNFKGNTNLVFQSLNTKVLFIYKLL